MAAYAIDDKGREFVAVITVEQRDTSVSGIEAYDVTHAISGRQKKQPVGYEIRRELPYIGCFCN